MPDPGTFTAVVRYGGIVVRYQLLLYLQRYHDDPDGGGYCFSHVVDQESAEAHHVQGRQGQSGLLQQSVQMGSPDGTGCWTKNRREPWWG